MMLNVLSPKAAIARAGMIPGTLLLIWGLNACILLGRLLILILDYIITFQFQTVINYEIGSRLFILDQYLKLENEID